MMSSLWNDYRISRLAMGILSVITLLLMVRPATATAPQPATLIVSPNGPYTSIAEALEAAQAGDYIEVRGGTYAGPLTIVKSVILRGTNQPIIDGGGEGSVVTIAAPGVTLQGFIIRNSGDSLDREHAGIVVQKSPNTVIVGNRVENTLFGIYVKDSPRTQVRSNHISGMDLPLPRRGDGIRFWQSPNSLIAENTVRAVRDCILWFSDNSIVRGNFVRDGRYGLHLMYDNDILITGNRLMDNHVGAYLMYSRRVTLRGNVFQNNRGPSGYGVGLKDMDRVIGEDNLFIGNRIGMYLDNSPWSIDIYDEFRRNVFAYNDIGLSFQPAVRRNIFTENTFLENMEQVALRGGGQLRGNQWAVEGRGNFWSDYAGYDANGDGIGDLPYQPRSLFESLLDRHPSLRLFLMSPAQQAIDMASRAFPILRPEPKLTDAAPLMSPVLPAIVLPPPPSAAPMLGVSGGMVLLVLLLLGMSRWEPAMAGQADGDQKQQHLANEDGSMIEIQGLTKRFGRFTAVDNFALTVRAGEAVALWGPNGAGKTTIIKCLLGLLRCDGRITVNGFGLMREGKAARRSLGYVPQELAFYNDLTARETTRFYARLRGYRKTAPSTRPRVRQRPADGPQSEFSETLLKGISNERADEVLARVGLAEHADKQVRALSGGMKQRLALAIALLADPPVLVLDEPTSNLDARARDDFLALLAELKQQGKTLLFTSHRLEEVEALADRVLALEQGRVKTECAPRDLAAVLGLHVTLKVYLPEAEIDQALAALEAHGFTAGRNGAGISVQVPPTDKAAPIQTLAQANIAVQNFEIEDGSWNWR